MLNKKDKELTNILERIYPKMEMIFPSVLFNNEKDCCPGYFINWIEFLKILRENGFDIIKKERGVKNDI